MKKFFVVSAFFFTTAGIVCDAAALTAIQGAELGLAAGLGATGAYNLYTFLKRGKGRPVPALSSRQKLIHALKTAGPLALSTVLAAHALRKKEAKGAPRADAVGAVGALREAEVSSNRSVGAHNQPAVPTRRLTPKQKENEEEFLRPMSERFFSEQAYRDFLSSTHLRVYHAGARDVFAVPTFRLLCSLAEDKEKGAIPEGPGISLMAQAIAHQVHSLYKDSQRPPLKQLAERFKHVFELVDQLPSGPPIRMFPLKESHY